ncbi:hypothetical protein ElyMa_002408800 [Elysia marginata]|uniref:Uncharacterized protein n=1 Tax=Elysia marginata TaxID=1093978 RepID=A0AAV4GEC3_9GAST|nr:hypothetical protein ElyMa_002408800 [Elysia marginata]
MKEGISCKRHRDGLKGISEWCHIEPIELVHTAQGRLQLQALVREVSASLEEEVRNLAQNAREKIVLKQRLFLQQEHNSSDPSSLSLNMS